MRTVRPALLLCLLSAFGLVAAACVPPATPTGLAPIAVVTATPESGTAPLEVELSSAGSTDPDGSIVSYLWDFGDGSPTATTADASHTFGAAGAYTVTLTATDDAGQTGSATTQVTVVQVNQVPTAVVTATPDTGTAPLQVSFTGSTSSDADGTIESYAWDFGDGASSTDADPTHTYATDGFYTATLTVTDDAGATASSATTITVSPNAAPTAAASALPTSGKVPLTVAFSSAGSSDADGTIVSHAWTFGDGATSSAADPTHVYTVAGTYTATLTVTDDKGGTDTATVEVQVNANQAPTAVASSNVTGGQAPLTVAFSSAGSSDPDGGITSYSWNFGDGNSSTTANPTYTYGAEGTYTAVLTVSDLEGATDTAQVTIDVDPIPNVPPTVVATAGATSTRVGLPVTFSSAGTTDSDGTITSYLWDFGDGSTSTAPNPSKTWILAGTYVPTLTVTDNAGASVTVATDAVVVDPNLAPTAVAAATPGTGTAPLPVSFSSAGSTDPDGSIVAYNWDFGDGSPDKTTATATHTYTAAGTYTATLTVTDDFGTTDTATVAVEVLANQVPTAIINASPQSGPRPLVVTFDGAGSSDPEGATLTYTWDFGDGGNGTGVSPQHTYAVGTYTATLTVTDAGGATSAPVSIAITVHVDDDLDGSPLPADCNDADASTYPGAPDALDGAGKDSNCDGVDGVLAGTILVAAATGTDGAGCGTSEATPCQTIPQGIARAGSTGRQHVLVTSGASYGGFSIASASALTVRGGYGADYTSRAGTTTSTSGVSVSSSSGVVLRDLTLVGPGGANTTAIVVTASTVTLNGITASSGTAAGAGSSAYAMRAVNASNVTVQNSVLSASAGIAGTSGSTPTGALTAGTTGASGVSGQRTDPAQPGATGGGTGANNGGNGGNSNGGSGANGANGGAGGAAGCNNCRSNSDYSGGGGAGGKAGGNGATGSHGAASTPAYAALYQPTSAANGGAGANGGGGGGGGGGGQACDYWACAGERTSGGSGGKGGGGGQGGGGGTAGTAAGGSFAVYSFNSTVVIDGNTTLTTANGGTGGNGAVGQTGASGGAGGSGGGGVRADCCTGTGGSGGGGGAVNTNGGNGGDGSAGTCCNGASGGGAGGGGGGNGGTGGSGGGGAGGPSVAMLKKGTGSITFGGDLVSQVTIGNGGAGGSSPGGGNAGTVGTAAKSLSVA